MSKVVLDTNILVSALIIKEGKPARIVMFAREGKFECVLSEEIIEEARTIFHRKHIQKRFHPSEEEIEEFLGALQDVSTFVSIQNVENVITADESDNVVLACAVEGGAEYLVSGDLHFLNLKSHRNVKMVTPAQFLEILKTITATSQGEESQ
ncbi:MAG: putative toxin-antitoxin system toxin component, PIN family [Chloroflexi bacterium]|nr:putative toxin-antitoxin system toxin component, PIN family [Chloroflexota bacterium]